MKLDTPAREQGQIVTRAYGWHGARFYRKTTDRSDGTVTWHYADDASTWALADTEYDPGGATEPPKVKTWTKCQDPEPERRSE